MGLLEVTIGAALREQAAKRGGREFLVFPNQGIRYTFADVDKKADEIAKGLLATGFKKGDHIGIWAYNIPDWAPLFYGAARVGIITVPINVNCKHKEIGFILSQADISALFFVGQFRDTSLAEILCQVVPELNKTEVGALKSVQFPFLRMAAAFDADASPGITTLDRLIQAGSRISDHELKKAEAEVHNMDTAVIMYTSGTTGVPKGAMLTHRNLVNSGYSANRLRVIDENSIVLNPLPFYYITSMTGSLVEPLVWGFKIVGLEGFDVLNCLETIGKEKCSWLFGVPIMYLAMMSHPRFAEFDMASVEYACIGGAMCPPDLLKKIMARFGLKGLYLAYGLTETSPFITDVVITDPADSNLTTVGDPIPGVEVSVRDSANCECLAGKQGEICTRGHNVMQGYYKAEEASKETIDAEGWLHTGDLGYLLPNGFLVIDGRLKELIIRGGENVYPKEVENLLLSMPGIHDAQVAGIPSEKYGEEVAAFIILKPGAAISEKDVITFCKEKISFYKTPKYVFFVESFPLSGNGKVQKFRLGEMGLKMLREKGAVT